MKQENLNSDMADHSLAILLFMDFFKTILLKKKKKETGLWVDRSWAKKRYKR